MNDNQIIQALETCQTDKTCTSCSYYAPTNMKCISQLASDAASLKRLKDGIGSNVNHPEHYQGKHECIDIMKALFGAEAVKGFCKCNAFKYRFRADKKNGAEDIKKAEWYEDYLMKMENEND